MKITDVRTTLLTGPCTNDPFLSEVRKRRLGKLTPATSVRNPPS